MAVLTECEKVVRLVVARVDERDGVMVETMAPWKVEMWVHLMAVTWEIAKVVLSDDLWAVH
jgi:hypothetical protein